MCTTGLECVGKGRQQHDIIINDTDTCKACVGYVLQRALVLQASVKQIKFQLVLATLT